MSKLFQNYQRIQKKKLMINFDKAPNDKAMADSELI